MKRITFIFSLVLILSISSVGQNKQRTRKRSQPPSGSESINAHDIIYVSDYQGNGIYEVDPQTRRIIRTAKVSLFNANAFAWNKNRSELYVIADNGDNVPILRLNPLEQIDAIRESIGWNTSSISVGLKGIYIAVGTGSNPVRVLVLNPITKRIVHEISLQLRNDQGSAYLAVSPDAQRLYVSWDAQLDSYDTSDLSLIRRETFPGWTGSPLTVSPDGSHLYTIQNGQVIKLRADVFSLEAGLALDGIVHYTPIRISKTGAKLWIPGPRRIYEVSPAFKSYRSFALSADPKGLFGPYSQSIDIDSVEQHLYVLTTARQMEVLDLGTGKVKGVVNGFQEPASLIVLARTSDTVQQTRTGFYWPLGKESYAPSRCGTWLGRDPEHDGCYDKGLYHLGVDMIANVNDPVYAIRDGEIIGTSTDGEGNEAVFIKHRLSDNTEFVAIYGHVRVGAGVLARKYVAGGQQFASIGRYSGGSHLHFAIHPAVTTAFAREARDATGQVFKMGWGRASNYFWPDSNGFVEPIHWITKDNPNLSGNVSLASFDLIVFERWLKCSEEENRRRGVVGASWGCSVELWTVRTDGSDLRRLTYGNRDNSPAWSPDGQFIAFSRWDSGKGGIYVLARDGTNLHKVTKGEFGTFYPQWLQHDYLIYNSLEGPGLYAVHIDRWDQQVLQVNVPRPFCPRVSPDRRQLAFRGDDRVVYVATVGVGGWNIRRLQFSDAYPQSWFPDSSHLVVIGKNAVCHKLNIENSREESLDGIQECNVTWSPDGSQAVYQFKDAIWIMDSNGQNKRMLVESPDSSLYKNPTWSPELKRQR